MTSPFTIRQARPEDDPAQATHLAPTYDAGAPSVAAETASDAQLDKVAGMAFHRAPGFALVERVTCFVKRIDD